MMPIKPFAIRTTVLTALLAMSPLAPEAFGQTEGVDEKIPEGAISTSEPLQFGNPGNESGVFLGAGLSFGQARSTEEGASPGFSTLFHFEPGYQMKLGSWSRLETSLQISSGVLQFRNPDERGGKVKAPVGLGVLARMGYGMSLGNQLFGLWKVGFGPVLMKWEGEAGDDKAKADSLTGFAGQLGYLLVMPMGDTFDLTGGFTWTHMQADLDKVKVGGQEFDAANSNFITNLYQVELGLRLRL